MMWLFRSSIGRKVIMAVTGVALVLFLTFHASMFAELAGTADADLATNGIYHIVNTFHGIGEHIIRHQHSFIEL